MTEANEPGYKERRHPRMKANVFYKPTRIIGQKHQAPNISLGGMRIFSNAHHKKGETVNIELYFPSGKKTIALARVAWVDAYPKDSDAIYELGLEFIHMPGHSQEELRVVLERTPQ